jgi:hypothetical protein
MASPFVEHKRLIEGVYRGIFKERPIIKEKRDEHGALWLVVDGLAWLGYANGVWTCKIVRPNIRAYEKYPCVACVEPPPQREFFWQALLDAVLAVAHLYGHVYIDEVCKEMGIETSTNGPGGRDAAVAAGGPSQN